MAEKTTRRLRLDSIAGAAAIFLVSLGLTLYTATRTRTYIVENQVDVPSAPLGFSLVYFFGVVAVLGIALFFIPPTKLKLALRVMFAAAYTWGTLVFLGLSLNFYIALGIALAAGLVWLLWARVWYHDFMLLLTMVSLASVFGFLFAPWTFLVFMLIIAIYDFLAVRFGYMQWLAMKMSDTDTLPAFIIPRQPADWNQDARIVSIRRLMDSAGEEREFSILGGGDIGFPLLLVVSVYVASGLAGALIVAAFALGGVIGAYVIQAYFTRGGAVPALPPIFLMSLIGFGIVWLAL